MKVHTTLKNTKKTFRIYLKSKPALLTHKTKLSQYDFANKDKKTIKAKFLRLIFDIEIIKFNY